MLDRIKSLFAGNTHSDPDIHEKLAHLENLIGFSFNNTDLYIRALRHRSIADDEKYSKADSYERLEFLGDAVLDLIVSEIIFEHYPGENEGFLTKLRAQLVKGDTLAMYANKLNLGSLLVVGDRAKDQGIEYSKSILADVFEALIGALYLDKGYDNTFDFVETVIKNNIDFDEVIKSLDNYKSILLEYTQAQQWEIPEYEVVEETGPGHDKTFKVVARIADKQMGKGVGKSKKKAEQRAAHNALKELDVDIARHRTG